MFTTIMLSLLGLALAAGMSSADDLLDTVDASTDDPDTPDDVTPDQDTQNIIDFLRGDTLIQNEPGSDESTTGADVAVDGADETVAGGSAGDMLDYCALPMNGAEAVADDGAIETMGDDLSLVCDIADEEAATVDASETDTVENENAAADKHDKTAETEETKTDKVVGEEKSKEATDKEDKVAAKDHTCVAGDEMADETPADTPATDDMAEAGDAPVEGDMPGEMGSEDGTVGDDMADATSPAEDAPGMDMADDTPIDMDMADDLTDGIDTMTGDADDDMLDATPPSDVTDEAATGGLLTADAGADSVTGTAGDDEIYGFAAPIADGGEAGEEDTGADALLGEAGNDTITGNDGDIITTGDGEDLVRVLGLDRIGESAVVVTDFDPAEDVLVLVDSAGADVTFNSTNPDGTFNSDSIVEIRATDGGASTEVIYDDRVIALLQGTQIDDLDSQPAWLANGDALVLVQLAAA